MSDDIDAFLCDLEEVHQSSGPPTAPAPMDAAATDAPGKRKREEDDDASRKASKPETIRCMRGMVVLKDYLTVEQQQELATYALPLLEHESRAKNEVTKNMKQLTIGNKKSSVQEIPSHVAALALAASQAACDAAPGELQPLTAPRTCVLNWYTEDSRLGMHVDKRGRQRGVPVVSFSIGDSCDFIWKRSWSKKDKPVTVRLCSGDALVFGGAAESIVHSVPKIFPNSGPSRFAWGPGRLNITLRDHRG